MKNGCVHPNLADDYYRADIRNLSSITFDTHKFVKDLRESGIPEPQAEVFIRAQEETLS